jgi:rod shape-determining protein MreC
MLDFPTRRRPFTLLTVVVLSQVLLLAFQVKREHDVRLIRLWAFEILTPLQRAGTWSISTVRGGWRNYIDLRHARAENDHLRSDLDRLELRNRELESRSSEADRLAKLLDFRDSRATAPMLAAQVIGAGADSVSHIIFINRGERDRLRRNMPVITPEGVVGKIVEVFPDSAQVLLIDDKDSGVGALLTDTRTHGVIKGTGEPTVHLEYIVNQEKVHPGELVVTSGEDRIYPKDFPVGTVTEVKQGNTFQQIIVEPSARLDRIEEVIILLTQQEISPKKSAEAPAPAPPVNTAPGAPAPPPPAAQSAPKPATHP